MVDFGVKICLIMSVAQLWKRSGLKTELIPLLNVLIGLLLTFFWLEDFDFMILIQQGLILGLSASGVYDVGSCFRKIQ